MARLVRRSLIYSASLIALTMVGSFTPVASTWGFHFLSFLPVSVRFGYLFLATILFFWILRTDLASIIERPVKVMTERPVVFLLITILICAVVAILFRVSVPLLGDSFILIRNFANTYNDIHPFKSPHAPLATLYSYAFVALTGWIDFPGMLTAFLLAELILGAIFVGGAFMLVRNIFEDARMQFGAFVLVLALPASELFFGYVEIYAASLVAIVVYTLLGILYLREKISFLLLPPVFLLMVLTHYLNASLILSLFYLGVMEIRGQNIKRVVGGAAMAVVVLLAAMFIAGDSIHRFLPHAGRSPILGLSPGGDISQAYGLFSLSHLIDILNALILLAAPALALIFVWRIQPLRPATAAGHTMVRFLALAIVPTIVFLLVVKFDLPMGVDWDVLAPYSVLALLAGLAYIARRETTEALPALGLIFIATALNSLVWFSINASSIPAIRRAEAFLDRRFASQEGTYQLTFHLTEYFDRTSRLDNAVAFMHRFIDRYPTDTRGYASLIGYLINSRSGRDDEVCDAFERWIAVAPTNIDTRMDYINFCLDAAQRSVGALKLSKAAEYYRRALAVDSTAAVVYSNLGIIYRQLGNIDSAVVLYRKAISLDSLHAPAYINLANVLDSRGRFDSAISYYWQAIAIDSMNIQSWENLSITYSKQGNDNAAILTLRQAARLGSQQAAAILREIDR